MKYYEFSNKNHYNPARQKNLSSRDEAYGGPSFDERYREHELHKLAEKVEINPSSSILVIGTGTGADACWFAEQGYTVTGIDVIQDAIDIAKKITKDRDINVGYFQDDICNIKNDYGTFDIIVDSFCLQSIVSDNDRNYVFAFIQKHLKVGGHYLIISAGYSPRKEYNEDYFRDEQTGIVYQKVKDNEKWLEDIKNVNGKLYLPVRRHHTIDSLKEELRRHNFKIVYSSAGEEWGDLRAVAKISCQADCD